MCGPGHDDAGERFWNEEAVPGFELPGIERQGVKSADPGSVNELRELYGAGLGDHGGAAWAVGREGAAMAAAVSFDHLAQGGGAAA